MSQMTIVQAKHYRSYIELNRSLVPSFLTRKFFYAQLLSIYQRSSESYRPDILKAIEDIQDEHISEYLTLSRDPEQHAFIAKCQQRNEVPLLFCDVPKGIQHDVFPLVRDNLHRLPYLEHLHSSDAETVRSSHLSIYMALACAPSGCVVDQYGTLNFVSLFNYMLCGQNDPMRWGCDPICDNVYNQINSIHVAASLLKRITDIRQVVFTLDMSEIRGWLVERIWDYDTMDICREVRDATVRLYSAIFGNFDITSLDALAQESHIRNSIIYDDASVILPRCKKLFTQHPRELSEKSVFMSFVVRVFYHVTDTSLIRDTINLLGVRVLRSRIFWRQLILTFKDPAPHTYMLLTAYSRKFPCVDVSLVEELRELLLNSSRLKVERLMDALDVE